MPASAARVLVVEDNDFTRTTLCGALRGAGVHVVADLCPHRQTQLFLGWVEGNDIRCFYHGWKFDPQGRCVEQPAESAAYKDRIAEALAAGADIVLLDNLTNDEIREAVRRCAGRARTEISGGVTLDRLPALADYPQNLVIPFKDWLGAAMVWLKVNFTWATRSLTWLIDFPLRLAFNLLAKGFKFGAGEAATTLPRLSWYGITLVMAWLGYLYGGVRLALLCGLGFLAFPSHGGRGGKPGA